MKTAWIFFPHQLHRKLPTLPNYTKFFVVEEPLFFTQFPFHKQKIILHRASMKAFAAELESSGKEVEYIEHHAAIADIRNLIPFLSENNYTAIHLYDPTDNWILMRIEKSCHQQNLELVLHETPLFITPLQELNQFFKGKKHYHHADFYKFQRKRMNILIESNGEPVGGQWSYDEDNRKKLPKGVQVPAIPKPEQNRFIQEAIAYTHQYFQNNPGDGDVGLYPVTADEAMVWLDDFIEKRLNEFGPYEDALAHRETHLFHSVLTPMLNIGILDPMQVVEKILNAHKTGKYPIASIEGFLRQIIGWREFMRAVYVLEGSKQRKENFFGFNHQIPESWWNGTSGIYPIDHTIQKILKHAYAHHIERLMVLGNAMLLHRFHPDETYRWFMSLFIDAYDWVMVPNVYGMSQFADGGLMTTKPYFSGSNYLMKMGDYPKGEWQNTWDALFWNFMHQERAFISKNYRLGMLVKTFDKMDAEKKKQLLNKAETHLNQLAHAETLESR
jgi:deoxyribodipyrimidine photolyase-related protein